MPLPVFGLVAEGATDHAVLTNILAGAFDTDDLQVRPLQPLTDATSQGTVESFGSWSNVLAYIADPKLEQALQIVDYVVIHIDTDVAQEFDVATHDRGTACVPDELVLRVHENLRTRIGQSVWDRIGDRIIFAVAVSSIECWLLILHGKEKSDRKRLQSCLDHLNRILAKQNKQPINSNAKTNGPYDRLSRDFAKRKVLERSRGFNPSLDLFLDALGSLVPPDSAPDADSPSPA